MKVYVVTAGSYSDYHIEKVFTDKLKAEEYRQWLYDANDIEEYETEDDLVVEKFYKILVDWTVDDDDVNEKPHVYIYKCTSEDVYLNCIGYFDYHKSHSNYFVISLVRYIPEQNWNEEFYRNKYTKAIYDLAAIAKHHRAEGASEEDIRKLFGAMYAEEEV